MVGLTGMRYQWQLSGIPTLSSPALQKKVGRSIAGYSVSGAVLPRESLDRDVYDCGSLSGFGGFSPYLASY